LYSTNVYGPTLTFGARKNWSVARLSTGIVPSTCCGMM
jgi:hypothetical protein